MARIMKQAMTALVLVALVPACASSKDKNDDDPVPAQDEDNTFAEDGTDANTSDTDAQLVASSLVSTSPGTIGLANLDEGSLGTRDVGDGVKALYLPRTCVDGRATAANEATYTFTNCIGPNGLTGVSGTVVATFTATATDLHLELTYKDMTLNGASLQGNATADIAASGPSRTMTWSATLDGKTAHDKDFSYRSMTMVAWTLGDACFSLDGTTEGQVRKRDIKTEVQNFKRCRRGCPEAGGKIIVTNVAKNKVVTIEFNGSKTATYTAPNGNQLPLLLICKE